jgi:predicted SprT family Zn-dependent metalloprotease
MDLIKLHKIKEFANEQLKKWGLTGSYDNDWCMVWDTKAKRRYGQCRYHKQEIGITKQLANINSIEESKDVVLHEIAHALTGRGHGHDAVWKRMCVRVGARPERCYSSEANGGNVKQVKGKYKVINKDTGEVYSYYHRRPKRRDWSAAWINGRKRETEGKLQVVRC